MLQRIGVDSVEQLFTSIPEELRLKGGLDLPPPLCEAELLDHLQSMGAKNKAAGAETLVFAGAGLHGHHIPAAVDTLSGRSEFYTAYTPYQPEQSQGTLLAIFEFQTMVAELLQMTMANASMYDGASATAEALLMAQRLTKRKTCILTSSLHPEYIQTCATYIAGLKHSGVTNKTCPQTAQGQVDLEALSSMLDDSIAAVVVQSPNIFGVIEDLGPICEAAHAVGALVISVCAEPLALALMRPPGAVGVDIAVGEGIGLSGPISLGGPGLGLFAIKNPKHVRSIPGRLVGQTEDSTGRTGYVLTLSTREQHIRREKAMSNICTNHGLMALRFAINLSLLGKTGFTELAQLNLAKAAYARQVLCALDGFSPAFDAPFFNELALKVPGGDAEALVKKSSARGIVPGVALGRFYPEHRDTLLVYVNESHSKENILQLAESLQQSC